MLGKKGLAICLAIVFLFAANAQAAPVNIYAQAEPAPINTQVPSYTSGAVAKDKLDIKSITEKKAGLNKAQKKIGTELLRLIKDDMLPSGKSKTALVKEMQKQGQIAPGVISSGDKGILDMKAYVYIQMKPGVSFSAIDGYVSKIENKDTKSNLAVAWIKLSALEELASLDGVKTVQTVHRPVINTGSVTSEGDSVLRADLARVQAQTDGSGVKIGIISDGVDNINTAIASGDLPAGVTVLSNTQGGDEGTAMLEIVHDLAPGAQLYFHDCGDNVLAFNQAIDALVSAGCSIICDDISWILEPFFEDGVIASHVDEIVQSNQVVFASSAGNSGMRHYQGQFYDDGYGWHDFSSGTGSYQDLYVNIPNGGSVIVVLEWNEPFGASGSDYDLYLTSTNYQTTYTGSEDTQSGSQDPLEAFYYQNSTGSQITASVVVHAYNAPTPKTLEVYIYCSGGASNYSNNITSPDSIFGHAAVEGVIACGAVDADTPNEIESFSSQGPVTMLSETRQKPDVCGTDGVAVTGAGGFSNPFYGTSASAPHVAAIAALIRSKYPGLNASQVTQRIMDASVDLGDAGFDSVYGNGRTDTLRSMGAVYTVTFDSQGGSSVQSADYLENAKITAPAAPTRTGYTFGGWYRDAECTTPWDFESDTVVSNTTLYAKWTINTYTVTFNSQGGSAVEARTAQYNTLITAPDEPTRAGYLFQGWYKQAACTTAWNFDTDKVVADTTLYAKWVAQYTITAAANNTAYGTVSGAGVYNSGATVTVRATPNQGYRFVRWLEGGAQVSASASYAFTAATNRTLTAEFAAIATPELTAASAGYNSVKLTWTSASGAAGYEVYRATSGGSYNKIKTLSATSYTDTGLTTGVGYYYKVRAYCTAGSTTTYGGYSGSKYAKPVPAAPASVKAVSASYTSIKISWGAVSGATAYKVYRKTSSTGANTLVATTSATSFTNTGLTTGKTYYYTVCAYRVVGSTMVYGGYSAVVSAIPVPAAPASVKAARASSTSIKVTWGAVSGATKYVVYRASSSSGPFSPAGTVSGTSFTNTGLKTGRTYYFRVRAYHLEGSTKVYGSYSAVVYAKP
ncbi:MAG: InlB B-repeat-containing protein [Bacillota bacterium]